MIAIFLSAVFFSLSFPNAIIVSGCPFLAWTALVPLLMGLQNTEGRQRLWAGLMFGTVAYGSILAWLWPLNVLGTILFVLALTLQPMMFIVLFRETRRPFVDLLFTPSLWVASEWLRTIILKGFCFSLGYSQAFVPPMIQPASWGGVYAVAFVIVGVNYCLYAAIRFSRRWTVFMGTALVIVLLNLAFGWWRMGDVQGGPGIRVAGIQANIEPHIKLAPDHFDENIQTHLDLTRAIIHERNADLIVWPETAFPWDVRIDRHWFPLMQQLARDSGATLALGTAVNENGRDLNSALVLSKDGSPSGIYHKNDLVPFCEYCPASPIFQNLRRYMHWGGFDFLAGNEQKVFALSAKASVPARFGILICSESCYPRSARRLANIGADFILVILNDGWFKKPEAIMIHAQNAVLRAVESGRDVVSVGNTGGTFRVDHRGVINAGDLLALQKEGAGIFQVISREQPTLYTRIGDIFAVVCLLFVIMILFFTDRNPLKT